MRQETRLVQKRNVWHQLWRPVLILFGIVLVLPALFYAIVAIVSVLSRPANPEEAKRKGDILLKVKNKTIVTVSAHPDDMDYWASGTLAKLHRNGNKIIMVIGTSGEKGANVPNLGEIREKEQERAGKIVGYDKIIFLRHSDKNLKADERFKNELRKIFHQYQPDILFTFDIKKEGFIYHHPDHEAAGIAAHAVAPEFKSIKKIYQFHTSASNVIVDVTGIEGIKARAMAQHSYRTQNNGWLRALMAVFRIFGFRNQTDSRRFGVDNSFEKSLGVKYAETFRVIDNNYAK